MSNQQVSQQGTDAINRLPKNFVKNLFDTAVLVAAIIGVAYVTGVL